MSLTPKQARFVREYLIDLNATQAAVRTGYTATNADVTGPRLLGNVRIAAAIEAAQKEAGARNDLTVDSHLKRLAELSTKAEDAEQYNAAITAEQLRGKVAGFYVEQTRDVTLTPAERETRVLTLLQTARARKAG